MSNNINISSIHRFPAKLNFFIDSIQKQNKKFPSSFFPLLPVHCYFNHNTQACLCGSSFHSTVKEQTKKEKKI